jgi:hypothetical protein
MPDLEDRLPDLLRDLSSAMPAERHVRETIRRARRRRAGTALIVACVVALLGVGSVAGLNELRQPVRQTPGGTGAGSPTPEFLGFWPETNAAELSVDQAQVDAGHEPWRTDAALTASAFATNVMDWSLEDVRTDVLSSSKTAAVVAITNAALSHVVETGTDGKVDPATVLRLARLGRTDDRGIWSVTAVDAPMIHLTTATASARSVHVAGSLAYTSEVESIRVQILSVPPANVVESDEVPLSPGFDAELQVPVSATDGVVVVVQVLRNGRDVLAATAFARPLDAGRSTSTASPSGTGSVGIVLLPPFDAPTAVHRTVAALVRDVPIRDIPALQALIDPNTFSYNADDGSNPIVLWKEDPSVLDPIVSILRLPPAEPKQITGYGTFYVWPYLVDSDFASLTPGEVDDLHMLGFDDAAIEGMVKGGRYTGPRLSIDENGVWTSYTTGGNH